MGKPGQGIGPLGSKNKSKPMNDTQTSVHYPKPPRPVRILANAIATTILRSPWHRMRSHRLLLLTFTGRKSGEEFTENEPESPVSLELILTHILQVIH